MKNLGARQVGEHVLHESIITRFGYSQSNELNHAVCMRLSLRNE